MFILMNLVAGLLNEYAEEYPWTVFFLSWTAWNVVMLVTAILFRWARPKEWKNLLKAAVYFPLFVVGLIVWFAAFQRPDSSNFVSANVGFATSLAVGAGIVDLLAALVLPVLIPGLLVLAIAIRLTDRQNKARTTQ